MRVPKDYAIYDRDREDDDIYGMNETLEIPMKAHMRWTWIVIGILSALIFIGGAALADQAQKISELILKEKSSIETIQGLNNDIIRFEQKIIELGIASDKQIQILQQILEK